MYIIKKKKKKMPKNSPALWQDAVYKWTHQLHLLLHKYNIGFSVNFIDSEPINHFN